MKPSHCDIAIIGGGPSGLALGVQLQETGADYHVFEAHEQAGGNIRSERRQGYLCEWGPNGFLDNEPATLRLVETLGLQDKLIPASSMSEKRWIVRNGKRRLMPTHPLRFLFGDMLSLAGRLRAGMEWSRPQRTDPSDETVFDFASRRVGREAAEVLVDAMVTGVFAGDSRKLSLRSTFPRMEELERKYGGLFRAMQTIRKEKRQKNGSRGDGDPATKERPLWHTRRVAGGMGPTGTLHSFGNGMQTLTDAMVHHVGDRLHTQSPLRAIQKNATGWHLEFESGPVDAKRVVFACPAWTAAPLLHDTDADLALELAGIQSAPVVVVCMGFREADVEQVERGFGFLIPGREKSAVLGMLFDSWVFPNRSEVGTVLFRTLIGGARNPQAVQLSDEELITASRQAQQSLLGSSPEPTMTNIIRHPRGIPQYNLGHLERLQRITARVEQHSGLLLSGNCYHGVALNACIHEAESLAGQLS